MIETAVGRGFCFAVEFGKMTHQTDCPLGAPCLLTGQPATWAATTQFTEAATLTSGCTDFSLHKSLSCTCKEYDTVPEGEMLSDHNPSTALFCSDAML